ncbi:MAG: UDP-N-acetylmuramoyl-tripeptide--D-alanyl-D-alanine ligase [Clostridiales bacterium]|nr:UDP-N-acetylmuramoyl-tripeptide--D-alanyl-D-alanine ligase [Clostridiales bacterium]
MNYETIYQIVTVLIPACICFFAAKGIIHYFQLESYQFPGYYHTLNRNPVHSYLPGVCAAAASALLILLLPSPDRQQGSGSLILWLLAALFVLLACLLGFVIAKLLTVKKAKKPFVFTDRIKRLYVVYALVLLGIAALVYHLRGWKLISMLWPLLLPAVVALAGLLAWPIEKLISEMYFRDARRKLLSNPNLIRIGLTGSYGKTTVKHILGTILSEKYPTLITPASFNTPMGVTRAIRERLTPSYQIFVGEMGARHVGDIKEMCRLVRPTIGIITSVGPQHLETFKTIERVAKTKYELIDALPEKDSRSYFYDDGSYCLDMYNKTAKTKTLCGRNPDTCDVWCDQVTVSPEGTTFMLHIKNKGQIQCQTKLLGDHSVQNILLAVAVASDLKLTLKQIAHGIEKLQPVKNRLELMKNAGGFTIINDAFNSNPVGAKAALEVLRQFPQRRIIITPGMVELGDREAEYNRIFGTQMKDCADIAIIIGKNRATPILEGLKESGFDPANIHRVDSLDDSTKLLHSIVHPGDTVLYENDLPDHYQEA